MQYYSQPFYSKHNIFFSTKLPIKLLQSIVEKGKLDEKLVKYFLTVSKISQS